MLPNNKALVRLLSPYLRLLDTKGCQPLDPGSAGRICYLHRSRPPMGLQKRQHCLLQLSMARQPFAPPYFHPKWLNPEIDVRRAPEPDSRVGSPSCSSPRPKSVRSLLDFFMVKVMKASWMGKEKDCRRRRVTSAWQIMRCLLCALASVVAMYDIPLDGRTEFADLCVLSSTQYHMRSCELSGSVQRHRTWSCRRIC